DAACRIRIKNTNNLLNLGLMDWGVSPTEWQRSTVPAPYGERISVIHDGIDTAALCPDETVQLQVRGWLHLDAGAVQALKLGGRSLLAVGVRGVEGEFQRGELVACVGPDGVEVARGLVNYDASESVRIMGKPTEAIESVLGYVDAPALIHRDDLVLV
ncbi:MAG TPA: hypothetical protein PLK47_14685, partial [Plasticicumulans sp.]|nr:hypothetical protein [Plasticicumulans sp.]